MMSGRDPGELGIYGFRNRGDRSYQRMVVANSRAVKFPRLWDILGNAGWRVGILGVLGTFPTPDVNGSLVSCFLAPNMDARHPLHEPSSPFAEAIHDYYRHVDRHIGELLAQCGEETTVLVVSDHGARPLMGGVCLNEWLQAEGYLALQETPASPVPLDAAAVDWGRTRV